MVLQFKINQINCKILLPVVVLLMYFANPATGKLPYEVYYKWKQMDFNFDCAPATRDEMLGNQTYIPGNVLITSLKVSGNRVFIQAPRLVPGVPSTVNWVPYDKKRGDGSSPLLNPYPSWEMQEIGNCKAIQSVLATEIDRWNRLWIFDAGRVNILAPNPSNHCPPKLLLIDLNTDKVIHKYIFPSDVVSRNNSLLKDVTLACNTPDDCMAYVCDIFGNRLIMYDHYRKRSWYVTHPTMGPDPTASIITILGKQVNVGIFGIGSTGLAPRSQNHDTFYYAALGGYTIYKVSTKVLMSAPCGSTLQDKDVIPVIIRPSQSDGMTMDAMGRLYYASLNENAVETLNTNNTPAEETILAGNNVVFQWPNTFGFDNDNMNLVLITDKFQNFGVYNLSGYNFRLLRFKIGTQSYMY